MRVLKTTKLEAMKSKWMLGFLVIFGVFTTFMVVIQGDITNGWSVMYMTFGGLIVCSNVFSVSDRFSALLPVKVQEQVYGRYLFGALTITLAFLGGQLAGAIQVALKGSGTFSQNLTLGLALYGVALLMMALEFLAMYLLRIRNIQTANLMRMVLPFLLLFGIGRVMDVMENGGSERIVSAVKWCIERQNLLIAVLLAAGYLSVGLCAFISGACEAEKY